MQRAGSSSATRPLHTLALALTLGLTAAAASPRQLRAQDVMDQKAATEVKKQYIADLDTVHVKIVALAKALPDAAYAWRPETGVRSVSEVLMHVASEWYFYVPVSVGGKPPADFGPPRESLPKLEKITSKGDVLAQLDKAWAHCRQQLDAADPAKLTGKLKLFGQEVGFSEITYGMTGDMHEHLGQLIAYARMNKVVPPWSKK